MRSLFILAFVLFGLSVPCIAVGETLAVIVSNKEAAHIVSTQELALIFKRKKLSWNDGSRIHPVNMSADHPWRRLFSKQVLKSLPEAQTQYWNNLYYHGLFPPHVVGSPEAMLRYVAETPGAIGYADVCVLDNRVKPVFWLDSRGELSAAPTDHSCPSK